MKLIVPPLAGLALVLLGFISTARAEISPFRVRVEQVAKSEMEKFTKTQKRSLKIFVSSASKEPAEVTAKYYIFGREIQKNDIVKLDEGAKPVSLKPLSTEMVESAVVTSVSEEPHANISSKGKGPSKRTTASKVEAGGTKIVGFAVQVFQGEKMVAESYDPPSMKEEITKAYPVTKPAAKK